MGSGGRERNGGYGGWPAYSRNQQLALLSVMLLILLVYGLRWWLPFSPPDFAPAEDLAIQSAFYQLSAAPEDGTLAKQEKAERFPFNPNTVTEAELIRLGLRPDQASSWLRYRGDRTNTFKRPADIAKLYKLDSSDVASLIPLIRMDGSSGTDEVAGKEYAAKRDQPPPEQFAFDPNTVTRQELERLGLSSGKANSFIKYREKAQPFRSPDDLDRLRLLDETTKSRLKPLVQIENTPAQAPIASTNLPDSDGPTTYGSGVATPQPYRYASDVPDLASVDINLATLGDLETLPGIGPYRAGRIIKFREMLGGFSSVQQLGTTYGIPDSTFQLIEPYLKYERSIYRKLGINLLSKEELAQHPYLTKKMATILVNYRQNHGPYRTAADLDAIRPLKAETKALLLPYLDFSLE